MVQLIFLVLFLFIVAICALAGLIRGINKTIVRLITFVLAIILSFFLSVPLTNFISNNVVIKGQTLGEMLLESVRSEETIAGILNETPLFEEAIRVSPAFVMAIVILPLIFLFCNFISWVIFRYIQKPFSKKSSKKRKKFFFNKESKQKSAPSFGKKLAGLGMGAIIGILTFGIMFAPILGIFSIMPTNDALNEALDTLVSQEILDQNLAELIKDELLIRDSALVKFYGTIGISFVGKTYLSNVSKIEADGLTSNLPDEFDAVFSVVQTAIEGGLLKALSNSGSQAELFSVLSNPDFMNELMQNMLQSKLLRSAVPKIAALAMESVAKSLKVPENKAAVYENMIDDIATAVKESTINYDLIKIYEDSQVATDYTDFVAEDEIVPPSVPSQEEYEAEKAKISALAEKISKIINASVSGSNENIASDIANQIVCNIQTQIMENGADSLQNFNADQVKATVSAISETTARTAETTFHEILEKMNDPEKFETDLATIETITSAIFTSVSNAVSDDHNINATASTLANVVSNFAGAVSSAIDENGQMDIAKLDFEKIADAVTTLQTSNLKEVGSSVLDIMSSGELGDNEMIGPAMLAVKESYDNGDNISGTINSTGALIVLGTNLSNGSSAAENIAESFETLVKNLDETTMKLLPSIFSNEALATMGVAEKHRNLAYNTMESLLRELMTLKNSDRYDSESDSVVAVYNIFIQHKNNLKEQLPELMEQSLRSEVLLNTLNKVTIETLKPEMLNSFGVAEKAAPNAYEIFKTFLNEIKICRENGIQAYDHEAFAIKFIYNLAKHSFNDITQADIQKLADAATNSPAAYNTLTGISESNPFGLNIDNEETRANLIRDIEAAFAASAKTEKDTSVFNAIARLFGLENEVKFS